MNKQESLSSLNALVKDYLSSNNKSELVVSMKGFYQMKEHVKNILMSNPKDKKQEIFVEAAINNNMSIEEFSHYINNYS